MPKLPVTFNWGRAIEDISPDLYRQLTKVYSDIANILNNKITRRVVSNEDPPASNAINSNYDIGDVWVRTDANRSWMLTSRTSNTDVVWTQIT